MNFNGGRKISEGFIGNIIDVYSTDENDEITLYNMIKKSNKNRILLYGLNKIIKVYNKTDEILKLLENKTDTVAKLFKRGNIIIGNSKYAFKNNMTSIRNLTQIFGKNIPKYTTIIPIFNYEGTDIYGMSYRFNYFIFQEKCIETVDNINFTQIEFNKFIKEIYESLLILKKNNFIHNDIKGDNIIKCNNKYKLIDWDLASYINNPNMSFASGSGGNFLFNHPIKFYYYGIPIFLYKIMTAIFMKVDSKTYEWLSNLKTFNFIKKISLISTNYLVYYNYDLDKLKDKFDLYSFAILILFLAEKNNLKFPSKLINKLLTPFHMKI